MSITIDDFHAALHAEIERRTVLEQQLFIAKNEASMWIDQRNEAQDRRDEFRRQAEAWQCVVNRDADTISELREKLAKDPEELSPDTVAAERIAELERQLAAEKQAREKAEEERDRLVDIANWHVEQFNMMRQQRDELAVAQAGINSWVATLSLLPRGTRTKAEQKLVEVCGKTLETTESILAARDAALVKPLVEAHRQAIMLARRMAGFIHSFTLCDSGPNSEWDQWVKCSNELDSALAKYKERT
jgi:molybdopterin converting factor small subunit